ncbi:MAG TPA: DUF547 domain-containing protein [Candidatus Binatia bacterium]|nr:DUF547 domain-containing protein [Candidatus Binatia bacterium]
MRCFVQSFGFRVAGYTFNPKPQTRNLKLLWRNTLGVIVALLLATSPIFAAPKADLWPRWQKHDPTSTQKIDHQAWDAFLKKYLVAPHPSGINRVRYASVAPEDRKALTDYLKTLQSLPISNYNRAEQRAYWINLYNALTVDLVLSRFPVESIRDINISPGLFTRGPWGAKLLTIEGEKLSLDDIEHRILRPIWKDNRVHYAVNCASLGCPDLQPTAYTSENTDALLDKGAREYINHPRGVVIKNDKLHVSSIYIWFQEDFGGSAEGLMEHWTKYADKPLSRALQNYAGGLEHDYDWRLNGAEPKPQP